MKKNTIKQQELEVMLSGLRPRSPSPEVKNAIINRINTTESAVNESVDINHSTALLSSSGYLRTVQFSSVILVVIFLCSFLITRPLTQSGFTIALSTNKYEIPASVLSNQNLITFCVGGINNEHNILTTPLFKWTNFVISN